LIVALLEQDVQRAHDIAGGRGPATRDRDLPSAPSGTGGVLERPKFRRYATEEEERGGAGLLVPGRWATFTFTGALAAEAEGQKAGARK
jgi:hypothetical protein